MANILPENETVTFEDQTYVNPETSLNEQNTFIDNLRASQARQNAEIQQQTQNLGTNVPSNLGGLVGGEGYFTSRYQTPQTNALVEQLRSTAQAQALSQVLENEQAMWKNRYNEAYRAAKKRNRNSGGGSPTPTTPTDTIQGGTNEKSLDEYKAEQDPNSLTITSEDVKNYGGGVWTETPDGIVTNGSGRYFRWNDETNQYDEISYEETYTHHNKSKGD